MQPSPDDQTNPPDRPGTPPRPPYSPVTPVLSHLAPVPIKNNSNNGFPAPSGPFSASASHPIVPPPARSPSPTSRIVPGFGLGLNTADISSSSASAFAPPASTFPTAAPSTLTSTSTPQSHLPFPLPPPQPPQFIPEPAPVPISESENPDAIALRSAISILQMQKQQSLRDLRTLERLKKAAATDPELFARELAAGNLSAREAGGFVNFTRGDDEDEDEDEGDDGDGDDGKDDREEKRDGDEAKGVRLGTIPTPQNVVRMPPVNWAKYQIVGDPLNRMHEEQRRRPFSGEPRREDPMQRAAPEHVLASPYRPLVDKLETPSKVRGASKSKKT